jgi:hypothetical protein
MLDQSGIESLLPPRTTTPSPTQSPVPPGTVLAGERVVFDSRDSINYNLPTESPEMIQAAAAITPVPTRPIEYMITSPPPPPPSSSSSSILIYVAVLALLICCLMAFLYFVSNRGGTKTSNLRNANQYNMGGLYN